MARKYGLTAARRTLQATRSTRYSRGLQVRRSSVRSLNITDINTFRLHSFGKAAEKYSLWLI